MKTKDNIPEGNPFKVPENYFEEVSRKIISATAGDGLQEKHRSVRIPLRQFFTIAASVAVLALLSYTGIKLFSPPGESMSLNGIPSETYTEELVNDIDLIVLEEKAVSLEIPEERPRVDNQDIIDYLIKENIDINDIYEQL
jgi:hypothetical protein